MKRPKSSFDPFVSKSLEFEAVSRALLKKLPKHIRPFVDFVSIVRIERSKTNPKLQKLIRDNTYLIKLKDGSILLVNIEHQSRPDIMMPVRFLHYGADSIAPYLQKQQEIPLLVQILLYHGERSPYPYHNTLEAYYKHPKWGRQELSMRFYLIDLTQISDAELLKDGHCAPMELLLKHGSDGIFDLPVDSYRAVFRACVAATDDDYIIAMLTYAASLSKAEAGERIFKFIEEIFTDKTDVIMTYGEQLALKGRQEGLQEGRQTRSLEIAQSMLQEGEPVEKIIRWTGLSEESIRSL